MATLGGGTGQSTYPGMTDNSGSSSSWMQWLPAILNFGGGLLSGASSASNENANRQLQAQEFAQQMGLSQNQQLMQAGNALNKLPLADKGQYLALNAAAPTAFQPRDFTQGLGQLRGQPTGGAAAQLAANQTAAANYRPGAGGVKPDTLNFIMQRLGAPQSSQASTQTINFGGKQYTPEEWSQYLNQNPGVAKTGV